jgi:rhodanese-related sulfurtransferase
MNEGASMALSRGYKQLLADALARIDTLSVADAQTKLGDPGVVFIDIREARELEREGTIPGAFHAPRGMLEFWVDPESPYHKEVFGSDKQFIIFCQSAWRSALATATLVEMGLTSVSHIEGGFSAWKQAGGPIADRQKKT